MLKIKTLPGQQVFFTSDYHEKHINLCRGTSNWPDKTGCRDFDTLEQMSDAVVAGHNKLVKPNDIVFNLGDIIFGDKTKLPEFLAKLSCKNIYFLMGNHDDWMNKESWAKELFIKVWSFGAEVSINGKLFVLNHYPLKVWRDNNKGSIHLFGHTHSSLPDDPHARSLDVGVDGCAYSHQKFSPWSFDEVLDVCYNKKSAFKALDHHR